MARLLSGRKATDYENLPNDPYDFLGIQHAEPYLGVPLSDNSVAFFDSDGTRRFDVPPVNLPGNEIQAQSTEVDADIFHVFVDSIGTNSLFLADPNIRFNPFHNLMTIEGDLHVTNDVSVGNNVSVVGTMTSTSDRRFKSNIRTLIPSNCLTVIYQLRPRQYNRNDLKGNPLQFGLVAQEVREVLGNLVHEDKEGKLSLSYQELIPLLIGAIQELKERIDDVRSTR